MGRWVLSARNIIGDVGRGSHGFILAGFSRPGKRFVERLGALGKWDFVSGREYTIWRIFRPSLRFGECEIRVDVGAERIGLAAGEFF